MTETAIVVAIILVPLLFGILEFGLLFKNVLTVENGSRAGARVGAAAAKQSTADRQIVDAVMNAMSSMPAGAVKKVVVYAAEDTDGTVPAVCRTRSDATARCNYYSGAALIPGATLDDSSWPPSTRINESQADVDYLGVWIEVEHRWVTGFFGSARSVSDHVVMRLEPTPRLKPPRTPPRPAPRVTTTTTTARPRTTTTTVRRGTTTTTVAARRTTTTVRRRATTTTTRPPAATTTTAKPTTTTTTVPPPPPPPPSRG